VSISALRPGLLVSMGSLSEYRQECLNSFSVIAVGGIDNCDGDRHLNVEAGGQEHTQWLAPVSRAASPYLSPVSVPIRATTATASAAVR
jgi:hypothetical protein